MKRLFLKDKLRIILKFSNPCLSVDKHLHASLMKQIPLATKSLRHKDTQSKENQLNKLSIRQLTDSDFVTLWLNNFLLNCYLFYIVFGSAEWNMRI